MGPGEREPVTDDPSLIFGYDDPYEDPHGEHSTTEAAIAQAPRTSRSHRRRRRRHRRTFVILAALLVVILGAVGAVGYRAYQDRYHPKDYSGAGTGTVRIVIAEGASAVAIGGTLVKAHVVQTTRAFTNAVSANANGGQLAPGTYQLHTHMSAKTALALLLDPSSRLSTDVVVFPGATLFDVAGAMSKSLGVSTAAATSALDDVANLGLPTGYTAGSALTSAEGFLYPATYSFDPGTKPADAVQQMITKFIDIDRTSGFAAQAKKIHLTPYQALIIASIAEKEARMPADYPKVARVILNRLAAGMPLQIDATSAYAAKLAHLDPTTVVYADIDSPYNTYTHHGLPPTPIANPGDTATAAAVHPAAGDWLYYVNGDAQGDLYFTNDESQFEAAVARCHANNWGCG